MRKLATAAVAVVSVAMLAACGDQTTDVRRYRTVVDLPLATVDAGDPTTETVQIDPIDTAYGGGSDSTRSQAASKYGRIFRITGQLNVSITKRYPQASNPVPSTLTASNGLSVTVQHSTGNEFKTLPRVPDPTLYLTLVSGDFISTVSSNGGTQPDESGTNADGTPWQCGPRYNDYCYSYGGSGSVTLTPLPAPSLRLSVDPASVAIGGTVTFTIPRDTVEGQVLPLDVDTVKWMPRPPDQGGEPSEFKSTYGCIFSSTPSGLQCSRRVLGSGELTVIAHLNGFRRVASVSVTVGGNASLTLTAIPNSVRSGDSVKFTATWSDGTAVVPYDWTWTPDSGTSNVPPCSSAVAACTRAISQSGTMGFRAARDGFIRSASAHVNALPCPPLPTDSGQVDNPLNDLSVRHDFAALMASSNPTARPGTNTNPTNWNSPSVPGARREQAMWVIRRANGDYYTVPARLLESTECSLEPDLNQWDEIVRSLGPGDSPIGYAHTHPGIPPDTAYGDCRSVDAATGDTVYASRWPGDTLAGRKISTVYPDSAAGGGSDADWGVAAQGFEVFTMNSKPDPSDPTVGGEIWRLPGSWTVDRRFENLSSRKTQWKQSCGWK